MASGIFAIFDDIAALMDDVAVAAKVATKKTAGLLGDDLAVNAEKATGFLSSRELPVLWKITKGSFLNKIIIVPLALLLNFYYPEIIKYILILGGLYLAYEGMEKIFEFLFHRKKKGQEVIEEIKDDQNLEKKKVKSAIITDFILSVEIVIIALGAVVTEALNVQIITVCLIAFLATVGVYGLVALIVRMDDAGYKLIKKSNNEGEASSLGHILVKGLPVVIKALSVIGTIALILVSGGIFSHNVHFMHNWLASWPQMLKELTFGILGGTAIVLVLLPFKAIWGKHKNKHLQDKRNESN